MGEDTQVILSETQDYAYAYVRMFVCMMYNNSEN